MCGRKSQEPRIKLVSAISLVCLLFAVSVVTARAQGVPQTVDIAKVNVQKVPAGFRASKIIGSSVFDDANENIGKVDDLLVNPQGGPSFAVLSVGGFLGLDSRYVAVPYDSIASNDNKLILRGSNKNSLKMLPEFKYADKQVDDEHGPLNFRAMISMPLEFLICMTQREQLDMAPRPETDSEAEQTDLAQRLTREIIGRELRELYEISEELPGYLQELMAELENRDE